MAGSHYVVLACLEREILQILAQPECLAYRHPANFLK
jgi:hypothetical protein